MPARKMTCGDARVISAPSNVIAPASAPLRPVATLKKVVLPEPLGPIRPRISLRSTFRSSRSSAVTPPNLLVNPRAVSNAVMGATRSWPPSRNVTPHRARQQPLGLEQQYDDDEGGI